jgi:hypothetical protein
MYRTFYRRIVIKYVIKARLNIDISDVVFKLNTKIIKTSHSNIYCHHISLND